MRTHRDSRKINYLLIENEIVTDKIDEYIQQCITPSAGKISKSLYRYKLTEGGVKYVYEINYPLFHFIFFAERI